MDCIPNVLLVNCLSIQKVMDYIRNLSWNIKALLIFVGLLLIHGAPDNAGREFIIGFLENKDCCHKPMDLELFITTSDLNNVSVTISAPRAKNLTLFETISVQRGQVRKILIDRRFEHNGTEMDSKGILVSASSEIVVYGLNKLQFSTDAFLGLPTDVLGTEYVAMCFSPATLYTLVLIIAVEDHTRVSILLPDAMNVQVTYNTKIYGRNDWLNVTMDRLDSLQLHSKGDLTGAYITSDKPLAVFSGNKKTQVSAGNTQDHLVEQLFPVKTWGKSFAVVPLPDRTTGDVFRFLSSKPRTNITVTCFKNGRLFSDEFSITFPERYAERVYGSKCFSHVTANEPIIVAQFAKTQSLISRTEISDPSMILIPPIAQFAADYTFTTPQYSLGSYINYVMFVVSKSEKDGLLLNDKPLPNNISYNDIPHTNPPLVGGFIKVKEGTYNFRHKSPVSIFSTILFGRQNMESYGFSVGTRLAPINEACKRTTMVRGDGIDNDCDGKIDEETCTPLLTDDDKDGVSNEDCAEDIYGLAIDTTSVTYTEQFTTEEQKEEIKGELQNKPMILSSYIQILVISLASVIILGGCICCCRQICLLCWNRKREDQDEEKQKYTHVRDRMRVGRGKRKPRH